MQTDHLWYKNAVIYAVDVHRYMDSNGDGRGDFAGLTSRIGYLAELGVTCLWLLPFYPTPDRDNGYDVADYYNVDPRLGTLDDFLEFLHRAGEHGIRVVLDLVMDHTSDEHPWFVAARYDPTSRFRHYYTWADYPPPTPPDMGNIFPGQENTVWTYDPISGSYYHHRFYHFEPDLNTANPDVIDEIERALDFWLSFGISGFRVDAASHMIESYEPGAMSSDRHDVLKDIRSYVSRRLPDAALIGEADVSPNKLASFFGDGDELNVLFNFVLNNYIFLAFAREEARPIIQALSMLPAIPASGQWANFLRNLDELDLERLPELDRQEVFDAFAPNEDMRIFGRGIRRRLAPMFDGDRRRLEMAFSLLFTLPGSPVIIYGDEIGMGEDLRQQGRHAVRAPMQWSGEANGGFSEAPAGQLMQPAIEDGPFGYHARNVAAQQQDPESFLNWMKRLIHTRRACPEFGQGNWQIFEKEIDEQAPQVLAHRCAWKDGIVIAVHNLSGEEQEITLDLRDQRGRRLEGIFGKATHHVLEEGMNRIQLDPYGYGWYRIEGEQD